jgi:hypothetical protein
MAYTREFLIDAYAYRFLPLGEETYADLYCLACDHYDKVGKDQFRVAASLDAEALRVYKAWVKKNQA